MVKRLMVVLVVLLAVNTVYGSWLSKRLHNTNIVPWDGVDTILIDGVDTVTSDTFVLSGYPYKTFTIKASQANDSVKVREVKLYLSTTDKRETFNFIRDVNGDTSYAMLHEYAVGDTGWSAPFSESHSISLPKCYRGYVVVRTTASAGNDMKFEILISEGP